jgi:hypothetical protein
MKPSSDSAGASHDCRDFSPPRLRMPPRKANAPDAATLARTPGKTIASLRYAIGSADLSETYGENFGYPGQKTAEINSNQVATKSAITRWFSDTYSNQQQLAEMAEFGLLSKWSLVRVQPRLPTPSASVGFSSTVEGVIRKVNAAPAAAAKTEETK